MNTAPTEQEVIDWLSDRGSSACYFEAISRYLAERCNMPKDEQDIMFAQGDKDALMLSTFYFIRTNTGTSLQELVGEVSIQEAAPKFPRRNNPSTVSTHTTDEVYNWLLEALVDYISKESSDYLATEKARYPQDDDEDEAPY